MSREPIYEIWGLDDTPSDIDGGPGHHREDCFSIEEATKAVNEWRTRGRAAWIVKKGDPMAAFGGSRDV